MWTSATRTAARCCGISPSRCSRDRPWAFWAAPARANPPWCICSSGSICPPAAGFCWTGWTSGTSGPTTSAAMWASCSRSLSCSAAPSARTSLWPGPRPPRRSGSPPPAPPASTTSSPSFPKGTTRWWASGASPCRVARNSGWPSPGCWCRTPRSASLTTPSAPWTPRPMPLSGRPWRPGVPEPPSSSATASPPCARPT